MCPPGHDGVVGEGSVAGPPVRDVRHAPPTVAAHGYRHAQRPHVAPAPDVVDARLDRDAVTRSAEAVALADDVSDGDALYAPAEAGRPPARLRHGEDDADAREVPVGHRHDRRGGATAPGLHAVRVARVDEVDAGAVERGLPESLVHVRAEDEPPAAIAQPD